MFYYIVTIVYSKCYLDLLIPFKKIIINRKNIIINFVVNQGI